MFEFVGREFEDYVFGFVFFVIGVCYVDGVVYVVFVLQCFFEQFWVLCDYGVGCVQDVYCGVVVLFQFDDFQVWEICLQQFEVVECGVVLVVDGLVVVVYCCEGWCLQV